MMQNRQTIKEKEIHFSKHFQSELDTYIRAFYPEGIESITYKWDETESVIGSGPLTDHYDGTLVSFFINDNTSIKGDIQIIPNDTNNFSISEGGKISGVDIDNFTDGLSYSEVAKTQNIEALKTLKGDK